jgi:hypothetical protein
LGLTSGVYYSFKYRARNIHGDGEDSDPISIIAATAPNQVEAAVVSLNSLAGVTYSISFTAPNPGGDGVLITAYEI